MTPSLGSMNLLEQLTEISGTPVHSLDDGSTTQGLNGHDSKPDWDKREAWTERQACVGRRQRHTQMQTHGPGLEGRGVSRGAWAWPAEALWRPNAEAPREMDR